MKIDPKNLGANEAHHLFISAVTPRPIAWVSTVNKQGINNLAPFSMYTLLSTVPAVVGFGIGGGLKKETIRNIEATKEFVVNTVTEELAEAMNLTWAPYPPSEFDRAGLTPVRSEKIAPPRVGQSPLCLECRVLQILKYGDEPAINSFVIGEVLMVHINDELWHDGALDSSRLKTIGKTGGDPNLYCRSTDTFILKR